MVSNANTSRAVLVSRAPVGSSARMIDGRFASARTMATAVAARRTVHRPVIEAPTQAENTDPGGRSTPVVRVIRVSDRIERQFDVLVGRQLSESG